MKIKARKKMHAAKIASMPCNYRDIARLIFLSRKLLKTLFDRVLPRSSWRIRELSAREYNTMTA